MIERIMNSVDFTVSRYTDLVSLALTTRVPATYANLDWEENFLLWRHDIDLSINRSLRIAEVDASNGLRSTFFLNLHSEFYNSFEQSQRDLLLSIRDLGHDFGVHFHSQFYAIREEEAIDEAILTDANLLTELVGVKPTAFSFHNPTSLDLSFEADRYGGLFNAYSKRMKDRVLYCSDSNGYWRHERLEDVLSEPATKPLQVLTHPGWWQDEALAPRQRIHRTVFGRARATMENYDRLLLVDQRFNHLGKAASINLVREMLGEKADTWHYLWNENLFDILFVNIWSELERQTMDLCKSSAQNTFHLGDSEVNELFETLLTWEDIAKLFAYVFQTELTDALGLLPHELATLSDMRLRLMAGREVSAPWNGEERCVHLLEAMSSLQAFGASLIREQHKVSAIYPIRAQDWNPVDQTPSQMSDEGKSGGQAPENLLELQTLRSMLSPRGNSVQ